MTDTQTEELSLREMLAKAGITQKKIAEKAKVSPAAVSLSVSGKSNSKRIEDIIRAEVEKVLGQAKRRRASAPRGNPGIQCSGAAPGTPTHPRLPRAQNTA